MSQLKETEFKKEIASAPKSLYYIFGDEKYLVKKYTKLLIDKITGKKASDFDLHLLNSDVTIQILADITEQLPIYSKKNCVVVSDLNVSIMSESDFQALTQICADLPETTVLIFSCPTFIYENKKGKSSNKEKKFRTIVEQYGTILELNKKENSALEKQLISWAEKQNCTLSQKNAARILFLCGNDMTTLEKEMEKLCAYCLSSEITIEAIDALVSQNIESKIFSLSTAIVKYDLNATFQQLHALFSNNEKPEIILSVLSSAFVDMYRIRIAEDNGRTLQNVAEDFSYRGREFLLKNARNNGHRFSAEALRQIIDILSETDIQLKSTNIDSETLIETLAARLIVIAHKESTQ